MTTAVVQSCVPSWNDPLVQFMAGQITPETRRAYHSDLMSFFGRRPTVDDVTSVTFHDVIAFRNRLAESGYQRSSINRKLAAIKAFYRMVVAGGIMDRNPADSTLVKGYRVESLSSAKVIPEDELKAIHQSINSQEPLIRARDMAMFYVLVFGGLRRSEVSGMDWDHIRQDGPYYLLTLPETKAGTKQEIKLQAQVVQHLDAYRTILIECGYAGTGPVFISMARNESRGKRLTPQAVNEIVQRHSTKHVTAHMFRHTCCTMAIEGGAKPQQVQAHLRHKDLKTTMRYYEHRQQMQDNASDYIHLDAA